MLTFAPGAPVTLPFALVDDQGASLSASAATWTITNQNDVDLADPAPLAVDAGATSLSVSVPGELNALPAGALRSIRTVTLHLTTDAGTVTLSESYLLQGTTALAVGVNSFVTYSMAALLAADMHPGDIPGWEGESDRGLRERALIQAYDRLIRLQIVIEYDDSQSVIRDVGNLAPRIQDLNAAQLEALDAKMLVSLRKAQLVEASEILSSAGDPVSRMRDDGLISRTVGQSSEMWRATSAPDLGASPRAILYLQRWLRFGVRLTRR